MRDDFLGLKWQREFIPVQVLSFSCFPMGKKEFLSVKVLAFSWF